MIAARGGREQEADGLGDRARDRSRPSRAARRATQPAASSAKPGDAAGGERLDRAGGDEVDAHAVRAEVAGEVARDRLERGLRDAHPVVGRPRDASRRSRGRRARRPPRDRAAAAPAASALNENADVRNACSALAPGVARKSPPSASGGANAIACRAPSIVPQRRVELARAAPSRCSASLTSSSSTSHGLGQRLRGALGQPAARGRTRSAAPRRPAPARAARRRRRSSRG